MLLILTEQEKGKVQHAVLDKILMEGIKKVFINVFLSDITQMMDNVNVLAASRLAVELLDDGFRELMRMNEEEKDKELHENIV